MGDARKNPEVKVDVDTLLNILKGKMSANLTMPSTCSIFRIPTILSRHSPNAFAPNQFSFGPFHHYNKTLKQTEKIKSKYLLDLINRFSEASERTASPRDRDTVLVDLTEAINNKNAEARKYYAGSIDPMTMEEFVEVLLLDGCFIVELFRRQAYKSLRKKDDPVFSMSCLLQFLCHDLILLENQVPWFVLEELFVMTKTEVDEKPTLVELATEFFGTMFSKNKPPVRKFKIEDHQHMHILDLLRNSLILPSYTINTPCSTWKGPMRSATALLESGVIFKPSQNPLSVLDITFNKNKGVLMIPGLFVQETTQTVLRNLIALEQCCPNYKAVITSYAVLLDNLINTRADMEILCKSGIVDNWLNVDEATKIFNKLYIDTYVKDTFYQAIVMDVNLYCKQPWNTYRRVLMRDYFKHPWAQISVIAASIILILTFLQTFFTIKKP